MSIISKPTTFTPSTTISSSDVNNNFDTIYNDYNGGISAANLADNAVTTAKITDANVTTAKILDANVTTAKLADTSVTSAKIDFGGSGAGVWWEEIARTKLSSAGDTITVSGIPARKYLHIQFSTNATGGTTNIAMTFNSDTGSNYAVRAAANSNVADGTAINQSSIGVSAGGAVAQPQFGTLEIINISSQEKYVIGEIVTAATGAGNVNERRALWAKWTNTAAQISTITFTNSSGTGDFAIGSEVIVLGHD